MGARSYFLLKASILMFVATQSFAVQHIEKRWDGYYAGVDIGGMQSNIKMQTTLIPGGTYFNDTDDASQVNAAGDDSILSRKFSGGVFAGYDRLFNNILVGGEASVNSLTINSSNTSSDRFITDPNILFNLTQSLKANWQGTLRLRLGLARQQWLAYLTGGAAMTHIKYTSTYSDDNSQPGSGLPGAYGSGTVSKIKFGWSLGGGGEYALGKALALKLEYLYSNFGNVGTNYVIIPTPTLSEFSSSFNSKAKLITQCFLVGLIYRF